MTSLDSKTDLSALRIDRGAERPPRRGRAGLWVRLGVVLFLGGAAVFYLVLRGGESDAGGLRTATVELSGLAQGDVQLTASGYVVAQRKAAVSSKATGRLVWLGVVEGDVVRAGDLLARVESDDVEAELARAAASIAQARADSARAVAELTVATLDFDRQRGLFERELIAQSVFDAAEGRYKSAVAWAAQTRAAIAVAEASWRAAGVAVENTRIRAPFDGTVLTKEADVGEMVAPFASSSSSRGAVVTMADMSSLQVEADVSESNITRVLIDAPCDIVLDAYPDHRYHGHVEKIVPTADRAKATVLTKVVIDDIDERVLPEMSAKVYFLGGRDADTGEQPRLVVSARAIRRESDGTYVFRVASGKVRRGPVTLGDRDDGNWIVTSGLKRGDIVVLDPPDGLRDGDSVDDWDSE